MNTKTLLGFIAAIVVLGGAMWFINRPSSSNNDIPQPPPPQESMVAENWNLLLKYSAAPAWGNPKAPWTIIECGDFQCPNCGKAKPALEQLVNDSHGKVKLYFVNFPIPTIHKHAMDAAEASLAASAQGKFWPMYDLLYSNQDSLIPSEIEYNARSIPGLNVQKFTADLNSHKYEEQVDAEQQVALQTGVQATPTFLVRGSSGDPIAYVGYKNSKPQKAPCLMDLIAHPPWDQPSKVATAKPAPATKTASAASPKS